MRAHTHTLYTTEKNYLMGRRRLVSKKSWGKEETRRKVTWRNVKC